MKIKGISESKVRKIQRIKESKDEQYDKKGTVTIDIYPESYIKTCGTQDKEPPYISGNYFPDKIDTLEVELSPRELAIAGILYTDLDWRENADRSEKDTSRKGTVNGEDDKSFDSKYQVEVQPTVELHDPGDTREADSKTGIDDIEQAK